MMNSMYNLVAWLVERASAKLLLLIYLSVSFLFFSFEKFFFRRRREADGLATVQRAPLPQTTPVPWTREDLSGVPAWIVGKMKSVVRPPYVIENGRVRECFCHCLYFQLKSVKFE